MGGRRRLRGGADCPDAGNCQQLRKCKDKVLELTKQVHFYRNKLMVEAQRRENAERQLLTDPLTGAFNRSGLEKRFLEECSKAERFSGKTLFMLFLDIDNFHRFNSEHGELTGDLVLQEVVRVIGDNLRPYDSVHRVGGEEFVVLLPEVEGEEEEAVRNALDDACAAGERIRRKVEELRVVPHDGGAPLGVTVSMGIARLGSGDSLGTLMDKANMAEIRAKEEGKNRCFVYLGGEALAAEGILKKE